MAAKRTQATGQKPSSAKKSQPIDITEEIMAQSKTQYDKLAQDVAKGGQEQFDAFLKSGNVMLQGFGDLWRTYLDMAQDSADKNAKSMKTLMGCKTLSEFTEVQNGLAQQNFDDFMSSTTKLSELGVKLCTETFEPMNDQINKAVKKAGETATA